MGRRLSDLDGSIEVIVGCVFSGKSDEGSKRIVREMYSKRRSVLIFTPDRGRREVVICHNGETVNTKDQMVSRSGKKHPAIEIPWAEPEVAFSHMTPRITTMVFEEAQFFSSALIDVCHALAYKHRKRVIVMGLDKDFRNRGFGPVPGIMVDAERVSKELATCIKCGNPNANNSWLPPRFWNDLRDGNQLPGDAFEPTCRICYHKLVEKYGLPPE